MTRIEEKGSQELKEKLDRMEKQIKHSRRRVFGCFNCLIYTLVLLVLLIGFGGYVMAKSGLFDVPFFTEWVYEAPAPRKSVTAMPAAQRDVYIQQQIQAQVLQAGRIGSEGLPVEVTFSEQYLSGKLAELLRNEIDGGGIDSQVAVNGTDIEVYIHKPERLFVVMTVEPGFDEDALELRATDITLGNLGIPAGLGNALLKIFVSDRFKEFNTLLSGVARVQSVRLAPGEMIVDLTLTDTSQILNAF